MERDELTKEAYKLHAQVCSIMANPKRLEIIELLSGGEKSVEELTQATGVLKANISQHLALLRHYHLVMTRKEGQRVFYKIANSKMIEACRLMREVTMEQLSVGKQTIEKIDRRRKVQERR